MRAVLGRCLAFFVVVTCACGGGDGSPVRDDAAVTTPELDAAVPVPGGDRFTLAVIPDTQYLFDEDRGNDDVLAASLHWIVDHAAERHIAFSVSLGDIVENAGPDEFAHASTVYGIFDRAGFPYSVLAGNHDLHDQRADDLRAPGEPYLEHFSPARFAGRATFGGASGNGFNTYHVFEGAGRQWLVLALDWRASEASIAWAQSVIDAHPTLPVIVTTHELAFDADNGGGVTGDATLSGYGQFLWDRLIRRNDQIFLTLNGHFWPPARTVMKNDAGHDVYIHVTNYQDRYYGGSGMIRLYELDLGRGRVDVSTFSPWVLAQAPGDRNLLERGELERIDADDRFSVSIDFAARFAGFSGEAPPPAPELPPAAVLVDGTVAYWRFEGAADQPVPEGALAVPDLSGHGNDLSRVTLPGGDAGALTWSAEHDPRQPSRSAVLVDGAYLRTADGATLNTETFASGYTIEAFVRFADTCCDDPRDAWMGILSRLGTGADLGHTASDPQEPLATLAVPPGGGLQWAVWPTNAARILTSWSHQLHPGRWIHVAIVNDGARSIMYVDGAEVLRNPRATNIGLSTTGAPWLLGANHYGNTVERSFHGWLGDVRIVDRPLTADELMIAGR